MFSKWLIRDAAAVMEAAGLDEAKLDAALLLAHVSGKPALELRMGLDLPLTDEQLAQYRQLYLARADRKPLQYLLGDQPFCGRSFHVDERVLIPRPETELLAERAIDALRHAASHEPSALDLCCGSGCLAVTMKLQVPHAHIDAADLSADALDVTRHNAQTLHADITLRQGDLWEAIGASRYDVIVSNPPYIPSQTCLELQPEVLREPLMALDGGPDGLDFYRRIAEGAAEHLLPGGMLLLEVGIGEAEAVRNLLVRHGLCDTAIYPDLNDIPRMVTGIRPVAEQPEVKEGSL